MATSPTAKNPDWHLELSQSGTSVGFVQASRDDREEPRAFSMNPYPKMASKLAQGRSKESDQNPPFTDVALSDFSSGRGSFHYDENKSKYFDGKRIDTRRQGRVILGPQETYIDGIRDYDENWSKDLVWQDLYSGGTTSITTSFSAGASYNANSVVVVLRKRGSPAGDVQVELLDASDTQLKTKSLTIGTDILADFVSERVEFEFSSVQALSNGTTYKVKVTYSGGDSSSYVKVGIDDSTDLHYRVLDDTADFDDGIFFEFEDALWFVTVPSSGSSDLYKYTGGSMVKQEDLPDICASVTVGNRWAYFSFGNATGASTRTRRYNSTDGLVSETGDNYGGDAIAFLDTDQSFPTTKQGYLYKAVKNATNRVFLTQNSVPIEWGALYSEEGIVCANNRAWADTAYANATVSVDFNGSNISVASGFTTGKCAHWEFNEPVDLTGGHGLILRMYLNSTAGNYNSEGDFTIILADSEENEATLTVPALTVDDFQTVFIPLPDQFEDEAADMRAITDMYWNVVNDEGAVILNLYGPIHLSFDDGDPQRIWETKGYQTVNNMIIYAGGSGQPEEKPWVITDRALYYLERGFLKKVPLREFEEFQSSRTGEGVCVHGVYLVFNVGETVQKYFSGQLTNIGPDQDYGLPSNRRGIPNALASYPGHIFSAIDAGASSTSSTLAYRHGGYHEMYRAYSSGERIKDIIIQAQDGSPDLLWFCEGSDIGYIPISINPETESGYKYNYEGVLETGRIYADKRGMEKYFHSVELVTEDLDANTTVEVDYRYSGNTTWQELGTIYNTSPRQKELLSSNYDVTGEWIQLRFRVYTEDEDITSVFVSALLESITRQEVNYSYSFNVRLPKAKYEDLNGQKSSTTGDAVWSQLNTWVDNALPVTISSIFSDLDGKVCTIEPPTNFRYITKQIGGDNLAEVRMFTLNLLEMVS